MTQEYELRIGDLIMLNFVSRIEQYILLVLEITKPGLDGEWIDVTTWSFSENKERIFYLQAQETVNQFFNPNYKNAQNVYKLICRSESSHLGRD